VSRVFSPLTQIVLALALAAVVGWPLFATVREAARAWTVRAGTVPPTGASLDPAGSAAMLRDSGKLPRPARLAVETTLLVAVAEAIALPLSLLLAFFL
jgi:hypothetical protein